MTFYSIQKLLLQAYRAFVFSEWNNRNTICSNRNRNSCLI